MAIYPVTNRRRTPQSEPIPGTTQVPNAGGGFSWALDDFGRLRRFLVLGSEGGTYYVKAPDLLKENHVAVTRCLTADGKRAVEMIVEVSDKGLAYRNEAAIYALALAVSHKDQNVRKLALEALPKVARIGTHLFHFAQYVNAMRGWGRGLRNAVANWYISKSIDQLALQAVKYQQRDGWSHSDLLRLAHPRTDDEVRDAVFRWMIGGLDAMGDRKVNRKLPKAADSVVREYPSRAEKLPAIINAFEQAKKADEKALITLITEHELPREAIPTQHLNSAAVWEALLVKMPATAMIRNLGKMTNVGLVKTLSKTSKSIVAKLKDTEWLKKSRVHPIQFLIAAKVYGQGKGEKGSMTWTPDQNVVAALEQAFYASFGNVQPIGKNVLLALDLSSSMGQAMSGTFLSCYEAEAALALVHVNIEDAIGVMGFADNFREVRLRKGMSLEQAMREISGQGFGATDCSLPFQWALKEHMDVQAFITMTDCETNHGHMHPSQALTEYRNKSGNAARSVVVGMTSGGFTIADPNDSGSIDVVGFDASTPSLVSDFCRGDV